jgi:hypothetical protein
MLGDVGSVLQSPMEEGIWSLLDQSVVTSGGTRKRSSMGPFLVLTAVIEGDPVFLRK